MHANGSRGDIADGFAFASFFPNVMQPPVAVLGNTIFSLLVRLRVCKRPIRRYDVSGGGLAGSGGVHGGSGGSISISLPGVENHDTERRRQIALKALSDRLSKAEAQSSATSQQSWPSLDGGAAAAENVSISMASSVDIGNESAVTNFQQNVPSTQQTQNVQSAGQSIKQTDSNTITDAVLVDLSESVSETPIGKETKN